ncbi:MAG: substrate-binding domain-containing protein [Nocardioides sp.]
MGKGSHAGERTKTKKQRSPLPFVGLAAALVVGGGAAFYVLNPGNSTATAGACGKAPIHVVVAPGATSLLKAITGEVKQSCQTFDVEEKSTTEVVATALSTKKLPDIWVPDTIDWKTRLDGAGVGTKILAASMASTPVVMVGATGTKAPASWGDALATGQVSMSDPITTTVGARALSAPLAEAPALRRSNDTVAQLIVPAAQLAGASGAAGTATAAPELTTLGDTPGRMASMTEQQFLTANDNTLVSVVPATGAPLINYALVIPRPPRADISDAAYQIYGFSNSGSALPTYAAADLRLARGRTTGAKENNLKFLKSPDPSLVTWEQRVWQGATTPVNLLAAVDTSSAMDSHSGIDLASQLVSTTASRLPDNAVLGLWGFSSGQGSSGAREIEAMRGLGSDVGGTSQRALIVQQAGQLHGQTKGSSSLVETAVAAYTKATQSYNSHFYNAVLLISNGSTSGDRQSLASGLAKLRKLNDPRRTVRIIAVGVGGADMNTLRAIAGATGGRAYGASSPANAMSILAQALINH